MGSDQRTSDIFVSIARMRVARAAYAKTIDGKQGKAAQAGG
jgi:hypothetical protein